MTESPRNQLLHGDCVETLRTLPEGCVDLVLTDPPFNIGYQYDTYDDTRDDDEYLSWCREWMSELERVLTPRGSFWLAIGDDFVAELKVLATRELGFTLRSWVVWYYTFGVNCTNKFSRSHTHLLYFVRDENDFVFNADDPAVRVPSARQLVYNDKRANPKGRLPDDTWILRPQDLPEGFGPDESVWYFPRVAGTFKERAGWHGCQMPERLLGRIILSCSNEGDLVLDPFSGSGSTLITAKKLHRDWLGCELSDEYAKAAEERLAAVSPGDPLEGSDDPRLSAPATGSGRKNGTPKQATKKRK